MKKKIIKNFAFILITLAFPITLSSCSNDDGTFNYTEPQSGSIDIAIGTFKGTLATFRSLPNTDQSYYYDAEIIVTKVDDQHVKITAKPGEAYSGVTERILKVSNYDNMVQTVTGELNGNFWYVHDTQTLRLSTDQVSETDYHYSFEGTKQ